MRKKPIIAWLLIVMILFTLLPVGAFAEETTPTNIALLTSADAATTSSAVTVEQETTVKHVVELIQQIKPKPSYSNMNDYIRQYGDIITQANEAYQALTTAGKAKIADQLPDGVTTLNQGVAYLFKAKISLPDPSTISPSEKETVLALLAAYEQLSPEQQALCINEKNRLDKSLETIITAESKIDTSLFYTDLNSLRQLTITEYNFGYAQYCVENLEDTLAYMTPATKNYLEQNAPQDLIEADELLAKANELLEKMRSNVDQEAIYALEMLCDGDIFFYVAGHWKVTAATIENARKTAEEARSIYEQMNTITKSLVYDYWLEDLKALEAKITAYDEGVAMTQIPVIIAQIEQLPSIADFSAKDEKSVADILEVRNAYESLNNPAAQAKITNYGKLQALELILRVINLPEKITLDNKSEIVDIRTTFHQLADEYQAALSQREDFITALTEAETAIDELEKAANSMAVRYETKIQAIQELINESENSSTTIQLSDFLLDDAEIPDLMIISQQAITIPAGKNIVLDGSLNGRNADNKLRLTRNTMTTSVITIENGGTLTLNNIDLWADETGDGTVSETPIQCAGKLTINDNTTISGFRATTGGAVHVFNGGHLILNGGIFKNNSAINGGAIAISGNSFFTMNNGHIIDNNGIMGGGIYIGTSNDMVPEGNVNLQSGILSGNKAQTGGAIYVEGSPELGISYLTLKNVRISNNSAPNNNSLGSIEGGGLWFCPNGKGTIYATSGGILVGNTISSKNGSDFYSQSALDNTENKIHLATHLSNGKPVHWFDEKNDQFIANTELHQWLKSNHQNPIALRSQTDADNIATTLEISDNHADWGGGIACNGMLTIGEDQDLSLTVIKRFGAMTKKINAL